MDGDRRFSIEELTRLNYRTLQQIAKAMSLPSNVKKVYLIDLIYAKTNKTPQEVDSIVRSVKSERQRIKFSNNTKKKWQNKKVQGPEITSTNTTCLSPPIDLTPKRSLPLSPTPSLRSLVSYPRLNRTPPKASDRVLRSTIRTYKKPNYSLLNDSSIIEVFKESDSRSREGRFPRLKVTRCLVKKTQPSILAKRDRQMPALTDNSPQQTYGNSLLAVPNTSLVPFRNQTNTIHEKPSRTYLKSVGFRHSDGKVSQIKAIVQKQNQETYIKQEVTNTSVSIRDVQDVINSNVQQKLSSGSMEYTVADSKNYPNMSSANEDLQGNSIMARNYYGNGMPSYRNDNEHEMTSFSMYFHKKIRSEQVRNKRPVTPVIPRNMANERTLPSIHNVFSRFNDYSDSFYVQPTDGNISGRQWVLEALYSLRALPAAPAPSPAPGPAPAPAATRCVRATRTVTTPSQQFSAAATEPFRYSSYDRPTTSYGFCTSEEVSRFCELMGEQDMTLRRYQEAANASSSSIESAHSVLGASVTLPEMTSMVEDALELISQDGDYMERISMDVRMQCILCSWAGPKFLLEKHIRDEHSADIIEQESDEWVIPYRLGALVEREVWLSCVCRRRAELFVLSARYTDPDCFMASLATLSSAVDKSGTITLYNKVSGEPYTWSGFVQELDNNMPYENTADCLKTELSKLELLPNSANLKLINRSLVLNSPSKVVVGQPELNDIQINIFVKIEDAEF